MGPPIAIEHIVGLLIPPACREIVLGDLHERFTSIPQYICEAVSTVPLVIVSRIRRTTDPTILLLESLIVYISFLVAAWMLDPRYMSTQWGLLRLAIPGAAILIGLLLADAYSAPVRLSPLMPIRGALLAVVFAFLPQAVLQAGNTEWAIPYAMMFFGAGFSLLLVCTIRLLFARSADVPQGVDVPAFWQRRDAAPMELFSRAIIKWAAAVLLIVAFIAYEIGRRG